MDLFEWAKTYPQRPGHSRDDTSIAAARDIEGRMTDLQAKVLAILEQEAATVHECARRMGEPVPSVQPRFSELRARGLLRDTGERRQNDSGKRAIVWARL